MEDNVVQFVQEYWRCHTQKFSIPVLPSIHDCTIHIQECTMYCIPFTVCSDPSIDNGSIKLFIEEFPSKYDEDLKKKRWQTMIHMDQLYVCLKSGIFHLCGEYCTAMQVMGKDHMYICPYTGLSMGDTERKGMFDFITEKSGQDKQMFRDVMNPLYERNHMAFSSSSSWIGKRRKRKRESEFPEMVVDGLEDAIRRSSALESDIFNRNNIISRNRLKEMNVKEKFMINAYATLIKFFSPERFRLEKRSEDELSRSIRNESERYMNTCISNQTQPIVLELYELIRGMRSQEFIVPDLRSMNQEMRKNLALQYARKCINLWTIVRTRTELGKTQPNLFPFNDFIFGALEVLENGLKIHSYPRPIVIIEKDDFLATIPLSNRTSMEKKGYRISLKNINLRRARESNGNGGMDAEEATGTSWNKKRTKKQIKKVGKKGKKANKMRSDIENAMVEAVMNKQVSPEMLRLDSIDYQKVDVGVFLKH